MELQDFLRHVDQGLAIPAQSDYQQFMCSQSQEAMRITAKLNGAYHTPEEIVALFSELTGKTVDKTFRMFPPFYTDFGKHITVGKNVFINSGCHFQDQGGVTIKDGALIGHSVTLATLNHDFCPERRGDTIPAPIVIGKNAWIGANATILPGVTVGENAVVAAGAVVTKDVPDNAVAAGVPARVIRDISGKETA